MGVYIKGMEMPGSCWRCVLSQLYEKPREMLVCKITHEEVLRHKVDGNCPLIPIPLHGRLIDADALMHDTNQFIQKTMVFGGQYVYSEEAIKNAPTIIEAEEGE